MQLSIHSVESIVIKKVSVFDEISRSNDISPWSARDIVIRTSKGEEVTISLFCGPDGPRISVDAAATDEYGNRVLNAWPSIEIGNSGNYC